MPDKSALTPEDIRLIMGNYQNVIQMNTILIEQQKQLLELQKQVLTKQDTISTNQNQAGGELKDIANKLDVCANASSDTNKSIQSSCEKLGDSLDNQLKSNEDKIDNLNVDLIKQHSGINKNIYIAWGGMASIVLGLVTLLLGMYERFEMLDDIQHLLENLAQYFNV